ncbi:MAG: J domain-containing protein [Actinomycetota bacterium]
MVTHYDVLGIGPDASHDVVRRAYRALAREVHPDHHEGDDAGAGAAMARLNEAWAVLSDPERRAHYDALVAPTLRPDPAAGRPSPRPVTRKEQWYAGVREQVRHLGHEAARSASLALSMKRRGLPRRRYEATIPDILLHLQADTEERVRRARAFGVAPLDLGLSVSLLGVRSYATELGRAAERGDDLPDLHVRAEMCDRMWDTLAHELRHEVVVELGGNPHLARWLRARHPSAS